MRLWLTVILGLLFAFLPNLSAADTPAVLSGTIQLKDGNSVLFDQIAGARATVCSGFYPYTSCYTELRPYIAVTDSTAQFGTPALVTIDLDKIAALSMDAVVTGNRRTASGIPCRWIPLNVTLRDGSPVGGLLVNGNGQDDSYCGTSDSEYFVVVKNSVRRNIHVDSIARINLTSNFYISQVIGGAGAWSLISLLNTTPGAASGVIEFFDGAGLALGLGAGGAARAAFNIPSQGRWTYSTDPARSVLGSGSARITSDRPLGVSGTVSLPEIGTASLNAASLMDNFSIPVRRAQEGAINTGIALLNSGQEPVNLTLTLYDVQGRSVAGAVAALQNIQPSARIADYFSNFFRGTNTSFFEGTMVVRASRPTIAASAFELGGPGQFIALPVIPVGFGSPHQ